MTPLTSKGNMSLDINKISQLSNSDLLESTSETSQPTQTSHACVFDIQYDTLRYRGQLLQDVQYRSRNKRVLNTKAKISWVYQYGTNLQVKGYKKL